MLELAARPVAHCPTAAPAHREEPVGCCAAVLLDLLHGKGQIQGNSHVHQTRADEMADHRWGEEGGVAQEQQEGDRDELGKDEGGYLQ